jgi:hypothetical protein
VGEIREERQLQLVHDLERRCGLQGVCQSPFVLQLVLLVQPVREELDGDSGAVRAEWCARRREQFAENRRGIDTRSCHQHRDGGRRRSRGRGTRLRQQEGHDASERESGHSRRCDGRREQREVDLQAPHPVRVRRVFPSCQYVTAVTPDQGCSHHVRDGEPNDRRCSLRVHLVEGDRQRTRANGGGEDQERTSSQVGGSTRGGVDLHRQNRTQVISIDSKYPCMLQESALFA